MVEPLDKKITQELKIYYNNPVTIAQKAKDSDKLVQIAKIAIGIIGQDNVVSGTKSEKVLPWLVNKLAGDRQLFNSPEETQKMREAIGQARSIQEGTTNPDGTPASQGQQGQQGQQPQGAEQVQQQPQSDGAGMIESTDLSQGAQFT